MPTKSFFFDSEPNVEIFYDEKNIITSIEGKTTDGTIVSNNDPLNPSRKEPISIVVRDTPIVNALRTPTFGIKGIPPKNETVERFKKVTEVIVRIASERGQWGEPFHGDLDWEKSRPKLGQYKNIVKFLYIADQVGFYDLSTKKRKIYTSKKFKDPKQQKQAPAIEDFMKNESVGRWRGEVWNEKTQTFDKQDAKFKDKQEHKALQLWRAMILLDMTPDEFLAGAKNDDPDKQAELKEFPERRIEALTNRLQADTFQAVGVEADLFPNKVSLEWWASSDYIPTETEIEDTNKESKTYGKMKKVRFAQQRDGRFDPSGGGVLRGLTRVMRHFAESNAMTGAWTELWSQKTPVAKHGQLDIDIHYLKDFEECLRNGVEFDEKGEFEILESEHKAKTNTEVAQRVQLKKFPDGSTKRFAKGDKMPMILADQKTVVEPDQQYFAIKKLVTTKEDWESAFLYFKVAMDLGWRAEEAFTSGANPAQDPNETGVKETRLPDSIDAEGNRVKGEPTMLLQIMTRKTAHVGRTHHGGAVINPETMEMIRKKRALVEEYGIDATGQSKHTEKVALEHGVIQYYISEKVDEAILPKTPPDYGKKVPVKIHALIGADGYFTDITTMDLPAHAKMRSEEKKKWRKENWQIPEVKIRDKNRDKIKAIMRHCYQQIFKDTPDMYDKYFKFHSLHALRHLFAQYWLKASAIENNGVKDFAMVMSMGHWGGIDVLMNFYGQSTNAQITKRAMALQKKYEEIELGEKRLKAEEELSEEFEKDLENINPDNLAEETGDELNPETGEPTQPNSEQVEEDKE